MTNADSPIHADVSWGVIPAMMLTVACVVGVMLCGCAGSGRINTAPRAATSAELTAAEVDRLLDQAEAAAATQPSAVRVDAATGQRAPTRLHIVIINRNGSVIGRRSMPDAWHGSLSIATAKAYTAMAFSSSQNAMSTRSIGTLSQPGGPLWQIGNSNRGFGMPGLIEFPGGLPLYKNGALVGGLGVSGDGPDEEESVALAASAGFHPDPAIRIDTVTGGSVRYVK